MKKVHFYRGAIIALICSLIMLSFFTFHSLKSASIKYSELEADYDKLKSDLTHSKNTVNSFQEQLESCELEKRIDRENFDTEIEFYKNLNNDKDMLIESLYQDRVSALMTNNPIDVFMRTHALGAVNTSTLLNNDYLYLNLWKRELTHAYAIFNDMVHPYFDEYLDESLSSLIDYANSEGEVSVAFMNVEGYDRDSATTNESFDHRAIDRAIRAWEISEIYKRQTYKIRNYITENSGEIEYLFNSEEFMIESEGLYIGKDYFDNYYSINEIEEGYKIVLIDNARKRIHELFSKSEPDIELISNLEFFIRVSAGSDAEYVYTYNIANEELSEPYFNPIYFDENYIVHTTEDSVIVTDISLLSYEDIIMKREWAPVGVLKHAIKNIKILDDILAITYLRGVDYSEVTEYINLK